MGKRSDSLRENRDWVGNQIGKAEVVNSEDDDRMEVGIEASDVGGKDGDGLGYGNEFSRLCLVCFCHIGGSIIIVVLQQKLIVQMLEPGTSTWTRPNWATRASLPYTCIVLLPVKDSGLITKPIMQADMGEGNISMIAAYSC